MRKVVLLTLIFSIFLMLSGIVNACTTDIQTILKLSSTRNAHGEIIGVGNYPIRVCYDDFFGTWSGAGDPHQCTGTNSILNLSGTTNAHAQAPKINGGYKTEICFGDLVCQVDTNTCSNAGAGYMPVLSLSSLTNAHLAQDSSYPNWVCCKNSATSTVTVTYQLPTPLDKTTSSTQTVIINSSVSSSGGLGINNCFLEVRDVGLGISLPPFSMIKTSSGGTTYCSVSSTFSSGRNYTYYVRATNSDGVSGVSPTREINITFGASVPTNNPFPIAKICAPEHKQIYFTNTLVNFASCSTDSGEIIADSQTHWEIDEGGSVPTRTGVNFDYNFLTPGQKTITLKVSTTNGEAEDQVSILLVGSSYSDGSILAFINNPFHKEVVSNGELKVRYNASDSYVINSTISAADPNICNGGIECLIGDCPLVTKNFPAGCSSNRNIISSPQSFNSANFVWKFDDQETINGLGKYFGEKRYSSEGEKSINLLINYTNSQYKLEQTFVRDFTLVGSEQCSPDRTKWYELENGRRVREWNTLNSLACTGNDQATGGVNTQDDCCPIGLSCSVDEANPGCTIVNDISECADYTDQASCNNAPSNIASNDPLASAAPVCGTNIMVNGCTTNVICRGCAWDNSLGSCAINKTYGSTNNQCLITGGDTNCNFAYESLGECINNKRLVNITAHITAGSDPEGLCVDSQQEVLCGQAAVVLPFFTGFNFLITLVIIASIYLVYMFFRRK